MKKFKLLICVALTAMIVCGLMLVPGAAPGSVSSEAYDSGNVVISEFTQFHDENAPRVTDRAGILSDSYERKTAEESHGFSLPGWEPERLALLETTLKQYESIGPDDLRKNYKYFLDAVIPVCEEVGVRMACHPDDPAWPIFGLPRITHSQEDFDKMVKLHDSPANTLCLCTGSLGSNPDNDIPSIIRHFGEMNRIGAMHVRNVKYLGYHHFREAAHLSCTGDLDLFKIVEAIYDTCPDTYIRPDHGRMIWDEQGRPGYGLYDRALGAAYINGLWEAIDKMKKR